MAEGGFLPGRGIPKDDVRREFTRILRSLPGAIRPASQSIMTELMNVFGEEDFKARSLAQPAGPVAKPVAELPPQSAFSYPKASKVVAAMRREVLLTELTQVTLPSELSWLGKAPASQPTNGSLMRCRKCQRPVTSHRLLYHVCSSKPAGPGQAEGGTSASKLAGGSIAGKRSGPGKSDPKSSRGGVLRKGGVSPGSDIRGGAEAAAASRGLTKLNKVSYPDKVSYPASPPKASFSHLDACGGGLEEGGNAFEWGSQKRRSIRPRHIPTCLDPGTLASDHIMQCPKSEAILPNGNHLLGSSAQDRFGNKSLLCPSTHAWSPALPGEVFGGGHALPGDGHGGGRRQGVEPGGGGHGGHGGGAWDKGGDGGPGASAFLAHQGPGAGQAPHTGHFSPPGLGSPRAPKASTANRTVSLSFDDPFYLPSTQSSAPLGKGGGAGGGGRGQAGMSDYGLTGTEAHGQRSSSAHGRYGPSGTEPAGHIAMLNQQEGAWQRQAGAQNQRQAQIDDSLDKDLIPKVRLNPKPTSGGPMRHAEHTKAVRKMVSLKSLT